MMRGCFVTLVGYFHERKKIVALFSISKFIFLLRSMYYHYHRAYSAEV